jgi:DNA-binding transcriptional ArsR family regulator
MRTAHDPLSRTFFALADPTRRAILTRLTHGAATVKELSAPFRMSGPAVSKHLRILERAGLIQRGRTAQWRPRTLEATPFREAAAFTDEFRRYWDESYARLDAYLEHLKSQEESHDERS